MESIAIFGCQDNGILWFPFILDIEIYAVNKNKHSVTNPPYTTSGFPSIGNSAKDFINSIEYYSFLVSIIVSHVAEMGLFVI
jgi:hypothetical protein